MDVYLEEYSSDDAIRKYTTETAGHGISYLLEHDYAEVYLTAINQYLNNPKNSDLRLLEFGCGGGMNIITLLSLLERKGKRVELAIGTDFSQRLIDVANAESAVLLGGERRNKIRFAVARNEKLTSDLSNAMSVPRPDLMNSFHVILGVNTFRYCHRLGKASECARDIADLLAPGGICVMIDMNRKFPAFRSRLRSQRVPESERYVPSLEEYASPFADAGLEVLRKDNFCWVPHSASSFVTSVCRLLTPALNIFAKPMAMRSLVISRKRA
jgi:SAM-dependent methyltransferase